MDTKVVPDEVLETTSCDLCCKYSTVTPIQSHEGRTTCGRCDPERSSKALLRVLGQLPAQLQLDELPLGLLGFLTNPRSLFPCVNRLDGCAQLLQPAEVAGHEAGCRYRTTECPRCRFEGVCSQLVHHFRRDHQHYLLGGWTGFRVDLRRSFREGYLFRKGDFVCLLEMLYSEEFGQCLLRTTSVTKGARRARIKLALSYVYEFVVMSKLVEICDRRDYVISLKIDDVHLKECPFILCKYDVVLFD